MKISSKAYKEALSQDSAHFNQATLDDIDTVQTLPWAYDPVNYSLPDRWVYERYVESVYKVFDQKLRAKFGRPARIIDLGCGPGGSSLWFALRGHKVLGIDAAEKRIQAAKRIADRYRDNIQQAGGELTFHCGDFFEINPGQVDAVISFLTFHHVPEPDYLIDSYLKHLAPDGVFLIYDQINASLFSYVASGFVAASLPPGTCQIPWTKRARRAGYRLLVAIGKRKPEPDDNPLEGVGEAKTTEAFKHYFRKFTVNKIDPLRIYHAVRYSQPKWPWMMLPWVYVNEIFKPLLPSKEVYILADCEDLTDGVSGTD